MSIKILNYMLLYIKTIILNLLYSTLLKDKCAVRIGNSMSIPYYYDGVWNTILVPYKEYSKDQYTIAKYYNDAYQLIYSYTVPKGMNLLVDKSDLRATECMIIGDLDDE